MIPALEADQLAEIPSRAEAKLYESLRNKLPNDYLVLFQVAWILRQEEAQAKDGEADFLICHPKYGYICIEVKGGGIEFDSESGQWFSIDRTNTKHEIKNPVNQALKAKYSISRKLSEQQSWINLGLIRAVKGHAVFFPDINAQDLPTRPDLPIALIGDGKVLNNPLPWIESAFAYWGSSTSDNTALGQSGVDIIRNVFARSFKAAPLVAIKLEEQEQRRLTLTRDQIRVLDILRSHRRAAISGGAGTGKTVLAVEKARRLANEGFKTLLTCYNRQLADHLTQVCKSINNLDVLSFHQLCHRQSEEAKRISGRDLIMEAKITYPGKDYFDIQLPNALAYTLDILPQRYDAIICDEGQDFREEYWVSIELLLSDFDKSPLYIFYDDNQNLYSRINTFPIQDEPFCLTSNCRNTAPIHRQAYAYYKGSPVDPPDISGDEIHFEISPTLSKQASKIGTRIIELISQQGVSPSDITVLVANAMRKAEYYADLEKLLLPKAAKLQFENRTSNSIMVDTIQRFKGLESQIVFIWGIDDLEIKKRRSTICRNEPSKISFVHCWES